MKTRPAAPAAGRVLARSPRAIFSPPPAAVSDRVSDLHPAYRRAGRLLLVVLVVYGVLVASHEGEFWPFSIYPMFSQAGRPWTRAVVRSLDADEPLAWQAYAADALPGAPVALKPRGIDAIDLANFVSKTERWTPERVAALRTVLAPAADPETRLAVLRVSGELGPDGVGVSFVPLVALAPDTVALHPTLLR